jgi:hypothetical protein
LTPRPSAWELLSKSRILDFRSGGCMQKKRPCLAGRNDSHGKNSQSCFFFFTFILPHSFLLTLQSSFSLPSAYSLQPVFSFIIPHSSFIVYFSPALRNAAIWRSNSSWSLIGTLCL